VNPGTEAGSQAGPGNGDAAADGRLRVVIADDQAMVRQGLELLLGTVPEVRVVASAADGREAIELVERHDPDAILLDLHMPVLDGIETTRRLTASHPRLAIVILTTYADDGSVFEALRAGALSYLTKDADRAAIAGALQAAARGLSVLDPVVQARLLAGGGARGRGEQAPAPGSASTPATADAAERSGERAGRPRAEPPDGLTKREAEILGLIAQGLTNPEIADRLFLSGHTIKTHINRIFTKTGSRDRIAAARYAREHGLS
jgi:DNA-binding NarL/FixJ family response regulator